MSRSSNDIDDITVISDYLSQPRRSLRKACRETGRDEAGGRCPDCPLGELCERGDPSRCDRRALAPA